MNDLDLLDALLADWLASAPRREADARTRAGRDDRGGRTPGHDLDAGDGTDVHGDVNVGAPIPAS